MISYFLCSVIETIIVKTTCFAITQTLNIGINCGSYLVSQLFSNSKRNRRKLIYMEDIIIHDVKMMDNRSKYIDYNSDSDSDYESGDENDVVVSPYKNEMKYPYSNESTSAYTMHEDMRRKADTSNANEDSSKSNADTRNANADSSNADSSESESSDNIESLNNQVQIIKDIINDKKYLNDEIQNEIRKKEELDEYLKNEYDKKVKEEIDNEWVSIQIFE